MGYLHINNLYKEQDILLFKRCYAMEKVHGTSAHLRFRASVPHDKITFFAGGGSHQKFVSVFDKDKLTERFVALGHDDVTVYGEAYGGKQQGMSHTYGQQLKFIVFDVKVGDVWLNVPNMAQVVEHLGLEVVPWEETNTDLDKLDAIRDRPSDVAIRRGMGSDKLREGVVLRPLIELTKNNGERVIVKHKGDKFSERATPQKIVDSATLEVLADAEKIALEWVVPERLTHVIDHLKARGILCNDMKHTGDVVKEMQDDVYREANGEIVESPKVKSAIGKRASLMFKERVMASFRNNHEV